MATSQITAELLHSLGDIADDDTLMAKVLKYVKKLASQRKQEDPTLMSKEEFYARVDKSLEQARSGKVHRIESKEELSQFLSSL